MGLILELVIQMVVEFLMASVVEALAEIGLGSVSKLFNVENRSINVFAIIAYVLIGTSLGFFAAILDMEPIILKSQFLRFAYMLLMPIMLGLSLSVIFDFMHKQAGEHKLIHWDRFIYGVLFGVSYLVTRSIPIL